MTARPGCANHSASAVFSSSGKWARTRRAEPCTPALKSLIIRSLYHPPFFRSSDGGGTWIDATGPLLWHVIHIAVSAASHAVLVQTEGAGLYKSVDGAQTWRLLNVFSSALFVDPGDETRVFGGEIVFRTRNGGAFVSQDSAGHFLPYGLTGQTVAAFAMNGSRTRLYAACYNARIYVTNLEL